MTSSIKILTIAGSVFVVGLATITLTKRIYSQVVAPVEFTVELRTDQYRHPTGELVRTERSLRGFRSDGSEVEKRNVPAPTGQEVEQRSITDIRAGKRTVVDGLTESTTTYILRSGETEARKRRDVSCLVEGQPRKQILGFDVIFVEKVLPGPPGERRKSESWRAPALNCFPLEDKLLIGPATGPLAVVNAQQVTRVEMGPPAPSYFDVPAGFAERSPSAVLQEFDRRYAGQSEPIPCANCRSMKEPDTAYQKQR